MNALLEDAPPRPEPLPGPAEPSSDTPPTRERPDRRWLIDVTIGVVSSLAVGLLLAGYQAWIDDERESRTQAVEADRAERDQVLANVTFIRETIRDAPEGVKPFRGMNLRGADLSGMDLGCPVHYDPAGGWTRDRVETCADFTGADLTGARLDGANLTGALLVDGSLAEVSATNLFAPSAEIGGNLEGSQFDGAVLFGSVFRSPEGTSSFEDTSLDGVQVEQVEPAEPGQEATATFTLAEVSMTGLQTGSGGDASTVGWTSIDCTSGLAQARRGGDVRQVASYVDLGDGGRVQCGDYGQRCDFDRFPQVGAQLVAGGVWKMPAPGCDSGFSGRTPEDTPAAEVTEFYDHLLPDWTREDIAAAQSL
ncbi:pentapeptide repeat-containing protein [Promicromonospora sp. NPDC019610]|uniref:pentapeptide repeat-containing protein n=1 Tax=Promicromonospora sp. NPDC019610 TaxID=3364405 RepID=UPI0037B0DD25